MPATEIEQVTFSNPRHSATVENWPYGFKRTTAQFEVSTRNKHGVRVERQTMMADGVSWNPPKYTTYADDACIVDGSDGKTYLLMRSANFDAVEVRHGNMKHSLQYASRPSARFDTLVALLKEARK